MSIQQNILTKKDFESIFHKHYVLLCRSALRLVQNEHTAEDLVQDVFCTLWHKKEELDIQSIEGYLYRSVYNASLNYIKNKGKFQLQELEASDILLIDQHASPEHHYQMQETQQKIHQVVAKLPEACRIIFILSRFENKSHKEIANDLNLSIKTVENQITKALRIMRQALLLLFLIFLKKF
jgi:RNA polymerase sigma-70 factor (ECF subfamily)